MEEVNCMMTTSREPHTSWSLRTEDVKPLTGHCYLIINQSENNDGGDRLHCTFSLTFPEKLSPEIHQGVWIFLSMNSLLDSFNKPFFAPKSNSIFLPRTTGFSTDYVCRAARPNEK